MPNKSNKDISLETLYELETLVQDAIKSIETSENAVDQNFIDKVEDTLVDLNLKTQKIYRDMISEKLSSADTKELTNSKKGNT